MKGMHRTIDQWGEDNTNWKGGTSRSTIRRLTQRILEDAGRDLYTCERYGYKGRERLPRHHKDRDRTNNVAENLEVICVSCHNREHYWDWRKRPNGEG